MFEAEEEWLFRPSDSFLQSCDYEFFEDYIVFSCGRNGTVLYKLTDGGGLIAAKS